jgi:hypothetical protein
MMVWTGVGTVLRTSQPAWCKRSAYSARVRSRPPTSANMETSMSLASNSLASSGTTNSNSNKTDDELAAARTAVVDDVGEQVAIGCGQGVGQEVPGSHGDARIGRQVFDDPSSVEQHSPSRGRPLENGPKKMSASASDVGDQRVRREVVVRNHSGDAPNGHGCHALVVHLGLVGVCIQIGEEPVGVQERRPRTASAHGFLEVAERPPDHRQRHHADQWRQTARIVGSQQP